MTNGMKAFVGKLLVNSGTSREQYAIEAAQSLFNMVQIDFQRAGIFRCVTRGSYDLEESSISLFYRDRCIGDAGTVSFTGRPVTKLGTGKLLTPLILALSHLWPFSIF